MNLRDMKAFTGTIIPVWYPENVSAVEVEQFLAPTLADAENYARPENTWVILDGAPYLEPMVRALRGRIARFEVELTPRNEGKGGAVAHGIRRLLANPAVQYVVTRDHDNDHLANDAVNLVRLAAHMGAKTRVASVVAIGRRQSIHRHLGFARGEYETFMNEIVMDAVRFAVSRQGGAVNAQFYAAYDLVPDMQTGFKCYSRAAAERLAQVLDEAERWAPGLDVRRHGAEVPILVETWLGGGLVGEINRAAFEYQPFTTYDLAGRIQVKGTVLAWTLQRTEAPIAAARQFMLNAIARRTLSKDEQGLRDLIALANWTLNQLARFRNEPALLIDQVTGSDYF